MGKTKKYFPLFLWPSPSHLSACFCCRSKVKSKGKLVMRVLQKPEYGCPYGFSDDFALNRLQLGKFRQAFLSQESSLSWPSEHKLAKHVVLLTYSGLLHILPLFIVVASWQALRRKSWYDLMTPLTSEFKCHFWSLFKSYEKTQQNQFLLDRGEK